MTPSASDPRPLVWAAPTIQPIGERAPNEALPELKRPFLRGYDRAKIVALTGRARHSRSELRVQSWET
jgi:hypothetical protein